MVGKYKVGEVMRDNIIVATPDESVYACAKKMNHKKVGCVLIVQEEAIAGIITEQDITRKVVAQGMMPRATPVNTVMSNDIISISPHQELETAIDIMARNKIKHLPVIEQGKLIGIITAKDILAIEPLLIEILTLQNKEEKNIPIEELKEANEAFNFTYAE